TVDRSARGFVSGHGGPARSARALHRRPARRQRRAGAEGGRDRHLRRHGAGGGASSDMMDLGCRGAARAHPAGWGAGGPLAPTPALPRKRGRGQRRAADGALLPASRFLLPPPPVRSGHGSVLAFRAWKLPPPLAGEGWGGGESSDRFTVSRPAAPEAAT